MLKRFDAKIETFQMRFVFTGLYVEVKGRQASNMRLLGKIEPRIQMALNLNGKIKELEKLVTSVEEDIAKITQLYSKENLKMLCEECKKNM